MAITGDSVPHFPEACQSFDADVAPIASPLPLATLHCRLGLQVSQLVQSEPIESRATVEKGAAGSRAMS